MKRILILMVSLVLVGQVLTGCDATDKEKLYVLNWGEYMNPDLIDDFEKQYNCKIVYEEVDSNEAMYSKIKQGATSYDIAIPSDYMIEKMISENMLLEINKDNLENLKNIDIRFLNLNFDKGNNYSIPYFWGTIGIMYNTNVVDEADLTGWEVLWNEKYEGQIYMYDSVRDSFAVSLLKLGYSINTKNDTELEEAKSELIIQKPLLYGYGTDNIKELVALGDAALGVVYSGDYLDVMYSYEEEGEDIAFGYFIPSEGTNLWFDNMVIPKTAQNKELAEKFIDFISDVDNSILNTDYVGYATVNKESYDKMMEDDDYKEWITDPSYYPEESVINSSEVYIDLKEYNEKYDQLWTEVKSAK